VLKIAIKTLTLNTLLKVNLYEKLNLSSKVSKQCRALSDCTDAHAGMQAKL